VCIAFSGRQKRNAKTHCKNTQQKWTAKTHCKNAMQKSIAKTLWKNALQKRTPKTQCKNAMKKRTAKTHFENAYVNESSKKDRTVSMIQENRIVEFDCGTNEKKKFFFEKNEIWSTWEFQHSKPKDRNIVLKLWLKKKVGGNVQISGDVITQWWGKAYF
jgi:hypothetical protein